MSQCLIWLCGPHLANVPSLDVLQFHQQLIIAARFELLDEYPAVRRLLVQNKQSTNKQILEFNDYSFSGGEFVL